MEVREKWNVYGAYLIHLLLPPGPNLLNSKTPLSIPQATATSVSCVGSSTILNTCQVSEKWKRETVSVWLGADIRLEALCTL